MKFEMVMPKMGESITEGTVLKWLKGPGDTVEKDETILEISTDKVDSEIPTPVPGKIMELLAEENETVEVGAVIALIETDAEAGETAEPLQPETKTEVVSALAADVKAEPAAIKSAPKKSGNRFYSPVVMRIAAEENISMDELELVNGSGLNGRVSKKDVLAWLESGRRTETGDGRPEIGDGKRETGSRASSAEVDIVPMDNMRKMIAEHMIHSKHTAAHVNLYTEVDMQNIFLIRERNKKAFKNREGFSLTYTAFLVEAVVKALKEFPIVNASIENNTILYKKFYNIGIAVAVENGLIVPNIFNADEKNLVGLARSVNDLATRARTKKLLPDEMSNGTFSISNFGVYGVTAGFPIINQPQSAILGVGAIKKRAVVINDAIAIRPIMYLSLTIDHRLIDGAAGSMFLERIREYLETYDPEMTV